MEFQILFIFKLFDFSYFFHRMSTYFCPDSGTVDVKFALMVEW